MIDLATTTRQFLRIDEVAEILTISRRSVYNYIDRGWLTTTQPHEHAGHRIAVAHLRAFVAGRRSPDPVQPSHDPLHSL